MNVAEQTIVEGTGSTAGLLTLAEMAVFLKVSKKTLYYWVARREIPYIKMGRHIRFDGVEVLRFFKDRSLERGHGCPWNSNLVKAYPRSLTTRNGSLAERKEISNGDN